jgi:hypothetical protein
MMAALQKIAEKDPSMKKLLCICAALMMAFGTLTARAADVTGSWTGEIKSPDGNAFQIAFTFKQDGTNLTGSVAGPQGDPIAISDGKVDGDKITFKVSFNGMVISHEGTFAKSADGTTDPDEIKMTSKSDQGDFPGGEMTLKRTKVPAAGGSH